MIGRSLCVVAAADPGYTRATVKPVVCQASGRNVGGRTVLHFLEGWNTSRRVTQSLIKSVRFKVLAKKSFN